MSKERGENKVGEKMPHLDERWVNYRLKDADFGDVFEFGEMVEEFSQRVTILNTFINIIYYWPDVDKVIEELAKLDYMQLKEAEIIAETNLEFQSVTKLDK